MSALVKCKVCSKEIAKGVKKCPNCGKDQRNWFMQHKILTFLGAIIMLVILGNVVGGDKVDKKEVNSSSDKSLTSSDNKNKDESTEESYQIGDTVNTKNMEITVSKFEELEQIGDPDFLGKIAPEGATLVAIQYTMKNVSDDPIGVFSYPSINLVDEKGTKYKDDIEASSAYATETKVDNSKVLSDLNPGITVTGVDVYEVSKEKFSEGEWYIKIGDSKVKIK